MWGIKRKKMLSKGIAMFTPILDSETENHKKAKEREPESRALTDSSSQVDRMS